MCILIYHLCDSVGCTGCTTEHGDMGYHLQERGQLEVEHTL